MVEGEKNQSQVADSENNQSDTEYKKISEDGEHAVDKVDYLPLIALTMAAADWLPELYRVKSCSRQTVSAVATDNPDSALDVGNGESINKRPRKGCKTGDTLTVSDVVYLCNFFYLPQENGPESDALLKCARWLIDNVSMLARSSPWDRSEKAREDEWFKSATRFSDGYRDLAMVVDHFTDIPNRQLLYDVYTYINDMRTSLALLNSYVKWHGMRIYLFAVVIYQFFTFAFFIL